jgi:hypothetical protein
MFSIGILGFIVWSLLMGSFNFESIFEFKNFIITICKNILNFIYYYLYDFLYNNFNIFNSEFAGISYTSEILCLNTFTFPFLNNYNLNLLNSSNLINVSPERLQWFIGFSEGDGALITSSSGNIQFVLTQNELAVLENIKSALGFGSISWDVGANCWRF